MAKDYLPILVPLLWVAVAVIAAMVLYRTSDSLFERSNISGTSKVRLKLTGSVVIAGCVYLLLWKTTGPTALETANDAANRTQARQLSEIAALSVEHGTDLLDLRRCIEVDVSAECNDTLDRLERSAGRIAKLANGPNDK